MSMESDYGQASWFEQKILQEGYQDVGAYYGYSTNGYQRFRHKYLINLLQQALMGQSPASVLDVGCGVGNFINQVAETFIPRRVLGVDFVEPVVAAAAEQFPHIEFRQDSLPKLDTISEKFDLIIASEVLYYLDAADQQEAVIRLGNLLPPNGWLLVSSTLAANAFTSRDELRQLVQPHFSIQQEWMQNSRLYLKLMQLLILSHRVETTQLSNNWPPVYRYLYQLFQRPVIGPLLLRLNYLLKQVSTPILCSLGLAAFLTGVGNLLGPHWAGSNVILLLQKEG